MTDFYQHRGVPTLHQLAPRSDEELVEELQPYCESAPVTLVLPSLFEEVEGEALPAIVAELAGAGFVGEVIVSMNRMDSAQFGRAKALFAALPQPHHIIWNDGPRMSEFYGGIREAGFGRARMGKGANVWAGCALAAASGRKGVIAVHDSDIVGYGLGHLARLCMPALHPAMGYSFCKGYYGRVSGRMNGRVMRLLLAPLLEALHQVCGPVRPIDFIAGFRYPLAGEFAVVPQLASELSMPPGWGLEVGTLAAVDRQRSSGVSVCQVPLGGNFRHKHRELESAGGGREDLTATAAEIVACLVDELVGAGVPIDRSLAGSIGEAFRSASARMGEAYEHDALFNRLCFDRESEARAGEVFARVVSEVLSGAAAGVEAEKPMPSWRSVCESLPDAPALLRGAVEADNT